MSIKARILSVLMAAVIVAAIIPLPSRAEGLGDVSGNLPQFSDMPENWSTDALEAAVLNGLLAGYGGKIMPDANLTRAQLAAVIVRAFAATREGNLSTFSDVNPADWYAEDLAKAVQMGIIQGWDGALRPDEPVTRQEVFVILARALGMASESKLAANFSDSDEIAAWAKGSAYALVNAGYIEGFEGRLCPADYITRAEFAQIMNKTIKQYITASGIVSSVQAGNIMVNASGAILQNLTVNGDLIIGDGVGDGELILDNVRVLGRLLVRGGGENSIIIRGSSSVSKIILTRTDGAVSVKVEQGADVELIYIADGSDDVSIYGTVGTVEIAASEVVVTAVNASIGTVSVAAKDSRLVLAQSSVVNHVGVEASAANTAIEASGIISSVTTSAPETVINGSGQVRAVNVLPGASGSSIQSPGTNISVETGVTGVTGGGGAAIESGRTVYNNPQGTGIITAKETSVLPMEITNLSVADSTTVIFTSDAAGADIKWNGVYLGSSDSPIQTVIGINTISVPPMAGYKNNTLRIIKPGYVPYSNQELMWRAVETITVSAELDATAVLEGETLQMHAAVLPLDADNDSVVWSVQTGTGSASIDAGTGLMTAASRGTVTVYATAADGSAVFGSMPVAIYPTAPEYTIDYAAETTNEIVPTTDEYSTNSGLSWTAGAGSKLLLTPGQNVWLRVSAAGVVPAGLTQTLNVPARPNTPDYSIDFSTEKIAGFSANDAYSLDGFATAGTVPGAGNISLTGALAPNASGGAAKQLSIITRASSSAFASAVQLLSIPSRPANTAVGSHTIDYVNETTSESVPTNEEYSSDGGSTWQSGTGAPIALNPGSTMIFRMKASSDSLSSETKSLTVPARTISDIPSFTYAVGSRDSLYGLPADAANLEARASSDGGVTWGVWTHITVNSDGTAALAHNGGELIQVRIRAVTGTSLGGLPAAQYSMLELSELAIGSEVVDKSWTWQFKTGEGYSGSGSTLSVPWLVVAKNHYGTDCVTLLSKNIIGLFVFDNSTGWHPKGNPNWESSNRLRPWLNSTGDYSETGGFYNAFSSSFKSAVLTTTLPNVSSMTNAAYTTLDKVFIPSTKELGSMDYNRTYQIGTTYAYFSDAADSVRIAKLGSTARVYWTRSPDNFWKDLNHCIFEDGSHETEYALMNYSANINAGVRPAVNVSDNVLVTGVPNLNGVYEVFYETH